MQKLPTSVMFFSLCAPLMFASCTMPLGGTTGTGAAMQPVQPYKVTVQGKFTCLPHRDTTGPQTMECALGMQTEEGKYYALDMSGIPPERTPQMETGKNVVTSGIMTPIEMISTDQWQKYNVQGILKVGTISD